MRSSPHETRESNAMRTRRNIPVMHFRLDNKGKAQKVPSFPNALKGTSVTMYDLISWHFSVSCNIAYSMLQ